MIGDGSAPALEPLERDAPLPLFLQVKQRLLLAIRSWPSPDRRFLSEAEIRARLGVSRVTVRRALAELEAEGHLRRVRGSGSYLRSRPVSESLTPAMDVAGDWFASGRRMQVRVVECRSCPASATVARSLGLEAEAPVLLLRRVRSDAGLPIAFDERFVSIAVAARCGLDAATAEGSIIDLLRQGCRLEKARWTIEARPATPEEGTWLGLGPGGFVLVRNLLYLDPEGRPQLCGYTAHRADMAQFRIELPLAPVP